MPTEATRSPDRASVQSDDSSSDSSAARDFPELSELSPDAALRCVADDPEVLLNLLLCLRRRSGDWSVGSDLKLILRYWQYLIAPHLHAPKSFIVDGRTAEPRLVRLRKQPTIGVFLPKTAPASLSKLSPRLDEFFSMIDGEASDVPSAAARGASSWSLCLAKIAAPEKFRRLEPWQQRCADTWTAAFCDPRVGQRLARAIEIVDECPIHGSLPEGSIEYVRAIGDTAEKWPRGVRPKKRCKYFEPSDDAQ